MIEPVVLITMPAEIRCLAQPCFVMSCQVEKTGACNTVSFLTFAVYSCLSTCKVHT